GCALTVEDLCRNVILPEQRSIDTRDPSQLPAAELPATVPPRTVAQPQPEATPWPLSLDEAIRISLENARVIRILAGTTAVTSGQTIYDAAITNTQIDQAQGRFDPVLAHTSTFDRLDAPFAQFNPFDPTRSFLTSSETQDYTATAGVNKTNVLGGQWALTFRDTLSQFGGNGPFPLNPQNSTALELSYTQPLLQGGGYSFNTAPIVIARLNTEQSFFQYKDSVQEMVRGVIEAYWNLVQARINVWARKIQVQQSQEAYERESARLKTGFSDVGTVAQARVTYQQFRANLIAAEADVLTREGALRNILGLPPSDDRQIIPVSVPTSQRLTPNWDELVRLAEQRRPDVLELKIITEADQARLLQAENQALPRLDATALYRWNGLSGTMPNGEHLSSSAGEFPDWSFGINFSVPLGLRQGRAQVRQQSLIVARDRANVDQQLHAAVHEVAMTIRDLESAYEQYLAYKETRAAAAENLKVQTEQFRAGRTIYLNVLQALNDWGNAVFSEAQQLLTYNTTLATLERRTGTILETHGLVFYEERLRTAGPLGILGHGRLYPSAVVPAGSPQRYPSTDEPAENAFDLRNPAPRQSKPPENLPPPTPLKPVP
ncbi:MAG TPA: TolC family protein, partial [Gemmataceae bacterium]|nr:TolC family protein [Gemmataceae bacterium]